MNPVYFVGLGPTDRRLGTERGAACLAQAEFILQDGEASVERIVELARAGRRVVRAVVGDPFEPTGGADEILAVTRAGVAVEVVPGVGWAAAAAAFVGVLGRVRRVPRDRLKEALSRERSDDPLTLVADVGLPSQRAVVTTVAKAPERADELSSAHLLLAFGTPDPALRWFERKPLFGKRVLVMRAREQAGGTAALLREHGADPFVVPTIVICAPEDEAPLAQAVVDLRDGKYSWAAFTSANGVDRTWDAIVAAGSDARAFGAARLAAIGPATAGALERRGLRADVVAKEFRGEGLADEMLGAIRALGPGGASPRVLIARAARARDVLPDALRQSGCRVDVVPAYETRSPSAEAVEGLVGELSAGRIDAVTFTSSSTVENFCELVGSDAPHFLRGTRVASIGPITTRSAQDRGIRVDVTASEYTLQGLVRALAQSYGTDG